MLPVRPSLLHACMPICQPPPQAGLKQADPTLSGPHMITDAYINASAFVS
jgi:hypothetical protein